MNKALYVIKLGSNTVFESDAIFEEIRILKERNADILLISGGDLGIKKRYEEIGREIPYLTLQNGDRIRHCSSDEMPNIVDGYEKHMLPRIEGKLRELGVNALCLSGYKNGLVVGKQIKPLKVVHNGRKMLVRNHQAGLYHRSETNGLFALLETFDVVCLSPPILCHHTGQYLNIDADVLAAELFSELEADHLRFVTSTPGILKDVSDIKSVVEHVYPEDRLPFVEGRMKQKVRASKIAIEKGSGDVCITGPHSFLNAEGQTWFWPDQSPTSSLRLLTHAISISSVSKDESELARYLMRYSQANGLKTSIDEAGNFVASKGNGPVELLLMGHIDTVPHRWKVSWKKEGLSGRGSVDAKSSMINFLETTIATKIPPWGKLTVIGATEEEVSSSKGAFYIRDNRAIPKGVIIGEPSGSVSLTMGYYGLLKLEIRVKIAHGHSAGKETVTASDMLIKTVKELRTQAIRIDLEATSAITQLSSSTDSKFNLGECTINFRVSPNCDLKKMEESCLGFSDDKTKITVLRSTPGIQYRRTTHLAKAFTRGFSRNGVKAHFTLKKGTSDMNTLVTKWKQIPMVAYGPGDSSLDHTDKEIMPADEFEKSGKILSDTLVEWFRLMEGSANEN